MAIIDGSPRSASARAKEECTLKEITEEQLKSLYGRSQILVTRYDEKIS